MNEQVMAEYQYILWDGDAPYEVIREHVSDADAMDLVEREGIVDDGMQWPTIEHRYARWTPDSTGEYDMRFELAKGQGRGAFPVTLLWYD